MARKPQVTRTITTTEVNVLCLNLETAEPFNMEVTLPRTYKDDEKLMKKVTEMVNTDTVKAVHVVDKREVENLYGMLEEDFVKYAQILPPRSQENTANDSTENE